MRRMTRRLYENFFMPCRLPEYAELLELALGKGYAVLSVENYLKMLKNRRTVGKCLVLRHDVDSDVETARHMLDIEEKLGVHASYYFRLQTVDKGFMQRIVRMGGESGYHFEEIATFIKMYGLKTRAEVTRFLPAIRDAFSRNLLSLRADTGLPIRIVASHGDWANRRLGIFNYELLNDELRTKLAIEAEAYDLPLTQGITSRISDSPYPVFWNPMDPQVPLNDGSPIVYILTHPRHWASNVVENLRIDLMRVQEACRYHWSTKVLGTRLLRDDSHVVPDGPA